MLYSIVSPGINLYCILFRHIISFCIVLHCLHNTPGHILSTHLSTFFHLSHLFTFSLSHKPSPFFTLFQKPPHLSTHHPLPLRVRHDDQCSSQRPQRNVADPCGKGSSLGLQERPVLHRSAQGCLSREPQSHPGVVVVVIVKKMVKRW